MKFFTTIWMIVLSASLHAQSSAPMLVSTNFSIGNKHFNQNFARAENVSWHANDNGATVSFYQDGVKHMAFYNRKGRWDSTIKYLPVEQLPKWIERSVNSEFRNWKIFFAQHVSTRAGNVYLVKIERERSWKFIKVGLHGTEVMEEYVYPIE